MKKEVLEKLYGSKVELSEVNVDLGLVDNVKNDAIAQNKLFDTYNNEYKAIQSKLKDLALNFKKSSDNYLKWASTYADLEKEIKDLGLQVPNDILKLRDDVVTNKNIAQQLNAKLRDF